MVGGLFFLLETAKVQKYPNQLVPQNSIYAQAKSKSEFLRFDKIDWNSAHWLWQFQKTNQGRDSNLKWPEH